MTDKCLRVHANACFIRTAACLLLWVSSVFSQAKTAVRPAPANAHSVQTSSATGKPSVACAKPSAWASIQIPEIRAAADDTWSWVNHPNRSADAMAVSVQQDLTKQIRSAEAAAGKYSDGAIQKDYRAYLNGVKQMEACPEFALFAQDELGLTRWPVFSIQHLTQSIATIHSLHQQAQHPVHVRGMESFKAAEMAAAGSSAPVQGMGGRIATAIAVTVSSDQQSRASQKLDELAQTNSAKSSNTLHPAGTSGLKASVGGSLTRSQAQTYYQQGLTRPLTTGVHRAYKPVNVQNYSAMNEWLSQSSHAIGGAASGVMPDVILGVRNREGLRFAFADASEEPEVRPDNDLDNMQTAVLLAVAVDGFGRTVRWEDVTRYTDYRDVPYTTARIACADCDALLRRGPSADSK